MSGSTFGEIAPSCGLELRARDLLTFGEGCTLEQAICAQLGLSDIEIVASGTAAILIALTYLRQQSPHRRRVIVPAYTCPVVVSAVAAAGLEAAACDTVAGGLDLDPAHLTRLVGRDTLAVIATHYGGALTDVGQVRAMATALAPGVAIIEDAAQAFGATWHGRSVGLTGDIGLFSFGAGKGFTIYEGGALVAREPRVMAGMRKLVGELTIGSVSGELRRALLLVAYHALYNRLGLRAVYGAPRRFWLARGNELRAAGETPPRRIAVQRVGRWRKAVGRAALARMPGHLADARARFAALARSLAECPRLKLHLPAPGVQPSATFLFVTLPASPCSEATIRRLWASRLGINKLFSRAIVDYPHLQPWLYGTETPHARALAATTLTLSTHKDFDPAAEAATVMRLRDLAQSAEPPSGGAARPA
jgi:perosamine synthetase